MIKVSAAEAQKQFGLYTEKAQREAITITKHGRDSVVMLSADAYIRLKSFDTRRVYRVADAPQQFVDAIAKAAAPEWTKKYDVEMDDK